MKKAVLTIGHNVEGREWWTHEDVLNAAADLLALDGFTAYEVNGMYKGARERSTRLEVIAERAELGRIVSALPALVYTLEQESILLELDGSPLFVEAPAAARFTA